MNFLKSLLIISFLSINFLNSYAQKPKALVTGTIRDTLGISIPAATVSIYGQSKGTIANADGYYELQIPAGLNITLVYSFMGFQKQFRYVKLKKNNSQQFDVILTSNDKQIGEVEVVGSRIRKSNFMKIDPKMVAILPNVSGNLESLIKTIAGVSSNNELSAQYTVRGGNYDENLVYVNDVEIYRPFLIRSGQQEGLSFINPDLVSNVQFSAGGFDAQYGDKMSSVLDIKYKRPTEFGATIAGSLLGGNVHIEGASKNNKFSYIAGARYKSSAYILNTLETTGEYKPSFIDIQSCLTYDLNEKLTISFLGNYAQNEYQFIPVDRSTSFGTVQEAVNLYIDFEGQEKDLFSSYFGALTFDFHPNKSISHKIITTGFRTIEEETFDIQGRYSLNQLDIQLGSESEGDSLMNIGIGRFIDHARNNLDASVLNTAYKFRSISETHDIIAGFKFQYETIDDQINEWQLLDSAGYSLPYNSETVMLSNVINAKHSVSSQRIEAYLQDSYSFSTDRADWNLTGGVRLSYWDFSDEWLVSPRFSLSYNPDWKKALVFRLSCGAYNQPAFYKELRAHDGAINENISAQKSIHYVASMDWIFKIWNRPFKFVTEIYHKQLWDIIPYEVDNVRIRYYANQKATGHISGIDMKINGEFVSGVESWFSLSLMRAREDVEGDGHGEIPRPSDQILNAGLFFQDYFPGNDSYKVLLSFLYGSSLPFGPPARDRYLAVGRMPSYLRVDIGISKVLKRAGQNLSAKNPFRFFKSIWLSGEVFNLLDAVNTVSYQWITVVPSSLNPNPVSHSQYAVPNYLTGRRFNLKLIFKI